MQAAAELAEQNKLCTTSYILKFNLSKLAIFLSNHYYKDHEGLKMSREFPK